MLFFFIFFCLFSAKLIKLNNYYFFCEKYIFFSLCEYLIFLIIFLIIFININIWRISEGICHHNGWIYIKVHASLKQWSRLRVSFRGLYWEVCPHTLAGYDEDVVRKRLCLNLVFLHINIHTNIIHTTFFNYFLI